MRRKLIFSSIVSQEKVEAHVLKLFKGDNEPALTRERHVAFLRKSLVNISEAYEVIDTYKNSIID